MKTDNMPQRRKAISDCQLAVGGAGASEPRLWRLRRHLRRGRKVVLGSCNRLYWKLHSLFFRVSKGLVRLVWPSCPKLKPRSAPDAVAGASAVDRSPTLGTQIDLQPGDTVRVCSLAEIKTTLDEHKSSHGCYFMQTMARYCGREFHVVKRVERFYDEVQRKMLRCNGIYLLKGVYCDGAGNPDTRGCDRSCLVFWREEWLEKVDGSHIPVNDHDGVECQG